MGGGTACRDGGIVKSSSYTKTIPQPPSASAPFTQGSLFMFTYDVSIFLTSTAFVDTNHNHPSNGWFALGLKAQYYRPAAQAAGFRILKPIAFATFAALERAFVLLATLKRVFVFFYTQFIKCYIMFFLFFYVFPYRSFI